MFRHWIIGGFCLSLLGAITLRPIPAEEPKPASTENSIRPGINDSYRQPDVKQSQKRFEKEGRDIYDFRHAIVHNCRLKPGMSVADIGCGTGLFTRLFAKEVGPTGKVFAVDISPTFLDHVQKSSREQGLNNVTPVRATDHDSRLAENSVDRIFICDVYHHFEFPEETLQGLYRALKPDGELIVIDFQRIPGKSRDFVLGHVRGPQEVFVREISSCGFKLVEEKPGMLVESYFLRFKKTASPYGEPTRKGKKLIEWGGGDEPETSFLRTHLAEMEKLPFDGVVFHVNDRQGENITWNLWGGKTYDRGQLQHAFDDLKTLKPKQLTELFVRVNVTPGKIDWFDDAAWQGVLQNMKVFAQLAKEGAAAGFMFDTESSTRRIVPLQEAADAFVCGV
ncbi:MAG: class I SAM-dependent methyltransferase [Planctomycetales bacterium]